MNEMNVWNESLWNALRKKRHKATIIKKYKITFVLRSWMWLNEKTMSNWHEDSNTGVIKTIINFNTADNLT